MYPFYRTGTNDGELYEGIDRADILGFDYLFIYMNRSF